LDRACTLRELARKAQGRDETRWVGYSLSRDVESRAVIGEVRIKGKPKVTLTALSNATVFTGSTLDRDTSR